MDSAKIKWGVHMGEILQLVANVATLIQTVVVVVGLIYVKRQIDQANSTSISERVMEHNWHIMPDHNMRRVVADCEELNVPAGQEDEYWSARAVHLNHIQLLSQVWELAGRPKPGRLLPRDYQGWQRFAMVVVAKPLFASYERVLAERSQTAFDQAAHDIWKGHKSHEVASPSFFQWLEKLAEDRTAN